MIHSIGYLAFEFKRVEVTDKKDREVELQEHLTRLLDDIIDRSQAPLL